MASKGSDILMKVVRGGAAVLAEAQSVFLGDMKADKLLTGFEAGRFFELTDFSFNVGGSGTSHPGPPQAKGADNIVDMEPVSFTRLMDQASMSLFEALVAAETLDSITVVKRKASGTDHSGEVYLRVDFTKALLTQMEWDDDELSVEEKWKFICREVKMQFRPQRDDGSLGAIVSGGWSMTT